MKGNCINKFRLHKETSQGLILKWTWGVRIKVAYIIFSFRIVKSIIRNEHYLGNKQKSVEWVLGFPWQDNQEG
jgi:hypothetical protein